MKQLPFDRPGRFWKGNLHTHTTQSDGRRDPEDVCRQYRDAGYDFLAITDHFLASYGYPLTDTRPWRRPDFATLLGAELHTGRTELGSLWHILAVGLPLDFAPPAEGETGPQIAARALATGAYVAAAHPNWYSVTEEDILSLGPIHAVEAYNGVAADHNDRPDSWQIVNLLLDRGHRYLVCATDDCHFEPAYHDFQRGWVWVRSESLQPEPLLAALKAGAYYSSTGPQIHDVQVVEGESIYVRCSAASRVYVTGTASKCVQVFGNGLVEAELSLEGWQSPYCRVTVRDEWGGRAWTNPIWFAG